MQSLMPSRAGFRYASFILLGDNVASPNSLIYDGPSPTPEKNEKDSVQLKLRYIILHNSFLDPKGVKICMTQSFKLNCSVSEDKDNCGEKSRRKCSKRNNGAPGPFITHRL